MEKLIGKTQDIVSENISKLKEIFPEAFEEGKIDFDVLKKVLGESVDSEKERYSFSWHGKSDAIKMSLKQSTGTLRPQKAESKDWDTTKNLFLEGDNLEVLRILQSSYRGKVKIIYIDPPYNTGNDFVYSDNFTDNIKNYKEKIGDTMKANSDSSGRYHTNWLNMMYPRLRLAKNLLTDEGVIFISIDDNEVVNLRKICDEVIGEDNFVAQLVWKKKYTGGKHTNGYVDLHEYILVYAKNINELQEIGILRPDDEKEKFNEEDEFINDRGKFYVRPLKSNLELRPTLIYPITAPDGSILKTQWLVARDTYEKFLAEKRVEFRKKKNGSYQIYRKYYENDGSGIIKPPSLIEKYPNNDAKIELKKLFEITEGRDNLFYTVKPTNLLRHLFEPFCNSECDIILDFFAGSATTAHAVMQINANDGGNRKFIMVQIPEATPDDSEAKKTGYRTIADIGKERIRRAGEKIMQEKKDKEGGLFKDDAEKLDIGFKVFTLDETNFVEWDENTKDVEGELLKSLESIKSDRSQEDALYEVLLKYGIDLATPIEESDILGKKVYSLANNYLLICLEKELSLDVIKQIAILKPSRVVFYDDGFADDNIKANAEQTLKQNGVEDIRVI
ncbi:MAG: site-specific DNA-methyltransferase [Candidatus Moraniibacteriota bacterium]